jgi:uncharacterized protein (TIGR02996 family)
MSEDLDFLRALFQQPGDDDLRLVYADWLEDRDDPRAGYLRLEVEMHRLAPARMKRKTALEQQMRNLRPRLDMNWVWRLAWLRNLPPGTRLDLVVLSDGKGLIDVRGREGETVLLVEGKPVAFNWDDCEGSVGQYLVFTGHPCGAAHLRQLWEFVAGRIEDGRPLGEQIEPLLALFAPGTYCLIYSPVAERVAVLECSNQSITNGELEGYYPAEDRSLVGTQPRESLDAERVAHYRTLISARQRPIVLTTSAERAWCEFILDGHHKLAAYTEQRVQPAILNIVRWSAPAISRDEGISFLPRGHRGIKEYRRMKRNA